MNVFIEGVCKIFHIFSLQVGSVPNTACNTSDPFMEKAASSLSNLDQSSSASTLPHNDDSRIIATYDINNTDGFNCAQFPKEDVQDCFVKSVQNALQVWIAGKTAGNAQ